LRALSLCTCCRQYPGAATRRRLRSSHPAVSAFPEIAVGSACTSSFSRLARRSLALRPAHSRRHLYVTCYTEGFSHFVSSMTAPVASGWSVHRVGLSPTGKRRLLTAHANSGHSAAVWRLGSNRTQSGFVAAKQSRLHSQPRSMPRERIERAPRLKAIFNVETNFLPNIDYVACRDHGVWVLSPTSAFAEAVAESALWRSIWRAVSPPLTEPSAPALRKFGLAGNERSFMFTRAPVGIIGFGDLGRKLRALIAPFRNPVSVYDPWLPDDLIRSFDCTPVGLDDLLRTSRVVFMFASVTVENQGFHRKAGVRVDATGRRAFADEPRGCRRLSRVPAAGEVRPHNRCDRRLPERGGRSGAFGGRVVAFGASYGRDDRGFASDRAHDRRRRGTDFAWAAAPAVPARRSRSRRPPAQHAGGNEMKRGAGGRARELKSAQQL
jgi:hypothetical protein